MNVAHPYERVKVEKADLDEKIDGLHSRMNSDLFRSLPTRQKALMLAQSQAMLTYSAMLAERMIWLATLPFND